MENYPANPTYAYSLLIQGSEVVGWYKSSLLAAIP